MKQAKKNRRRRHRHPAAFGRLCVETSLYSPPQSEGKPAAFGRLCVETTKESPKRLQRTQPPSGGCVLKQIHFTQEIRRSLRDQPPSGGCVLKQICRTSQNFRSRQPPSGGCVLKQNAGASYDKDGKPAAFGRLCVETVHNKFEHYTRLSQPPSGGCVLKQGKIGCRIRA